MAGCSRFPRGKAVRIFPCNALEQKKVSNLIYSLLATAYLMTYIAFDLLACLLPDIGFWPPASLSRDTWLQQTEKCYSSVIKM